MIAFIFPGQGSQYKGMGESLFDEFKDIVDEADNILGYSVKQLCLEDPDSRLSLTRYTQPALFTVNVLSYLKRAIKGEHANYLAGHSLGEYTALFAAGAFSFEVGLKLVRKRGELMSRASNGGMAAVLGLTEDLVATTIDEYDLCLEIANCNTPIQIVVSGPLDEIDRAESIFCENDAAYVQLNVSGAFHSSYMKTAQVEFGEFIEGFSFSPLAIPVISNRRAQPYPPHAVKEDLIAQIGSPVQWTQTIRYLLARGEMEFEEIGPGRVLMKLVRQIADSSEPEKANVPKPPSSPDASDRCPSR